MFSNKISLNQSSFEEFAKKVLNKGKVSEPVVKTASKKEDKQETTNAGEVEAKLVNTPEVCECKVKKEKGTKKDSQETTEAGKVESKLVNKPEKKEETKEASSVKFVKIGKLNSKQKSFFRAFWGNIYPKEYVEAMLAD